ncbi:TPA: CvpA family protein [Campylobacter lari]|uniref:CvpA family protein n=1 Tax=Campylobacter lari TaxID=201 RepID=UPI0014183D3F|nr:CvpA family protein [Campylobacter lari]EAH8152548.1 CvpA family protein [Campylobacter lari]EAI8647315.1 CvpA family protein [Campylobacter lari]EAJ6178218.1 CvpA family protein [Campylobacter lari]EAK3646681.1 CvpA family protein [Campylobacter lari]ECP5281042.1 CvpA family protein [Campylobacter lari]
MENFSWFDVFVLGLTAILGLKGLVSGLFKEIFGLLGIVGGVLLASRYAKEVAEIINNNFYAIENENLAIFAGFLVLLIVIWVACMALGNILSKIFSMSGLGFIDRIGGFLFGSAKIFLIFAILVACINNIDFLNSSLEKYAKNSYTLDPLRQTGDFIMNTDFTQNGLDKIQEQIIDSNLSLNSEVNNAN